MRSTTIAGAVTAGLLAFATACGGDDDAAGPTPGPGFDVSGQWSFTETLADAAAQITCDDHGTLTVVQNGSSLTGTVHQVGTCTTPSGAIDNSGDLNITGGTVTATTLTFAEPGDPTCHYTGTWSGNPRTAATGTVSCQSGSANFTGTWEVHR